VTGHPDTDAIAEFREGLLGRRRSARIRAHLARCSRCASRSSGLAEVTGLLASAPAPRIPDDLAARLDGVLAAESAARARAGIPAAADRSAGTAPDAAGTAPDVAGTAGAGRPGRARSARPLRPRRATALRAASVAAALLVIAGGGYGVSRLVQGGPGGTSSSLAGPAGNVQAGSNAHGGPANGGPARGGPAVLPNIRRAAGGLPVIESGTDYLPGRLPAQVQAVLARSPVNPAGQTPAFASGQAALPGCVSLITGGTRPRLVDVARYQGRPATIIVTEAAGGRPGQIWVAGPGCSAGTRDLIAQARLPGAR
jgi:hypothetical protein